MKRAGMHRTMLLGVVAIIAASPRAGRADADEASVHLHLVGGFARTADDAAPGQTDIQPVAGIAGRFTFATSNLFAYELQVAAAQTAAATYENVMVRLPQGTF